MEGFTIVDGVVAAVISLSALLAYSRGLVRESMAIIGWIAAAILAFIFAPQAQPLIKQIPVLDKVIGDSCELSIIAAFAAVFAAALILVSLFTPLLSSAVQRSAIGGVDQGLGLLFGVARGALLVAVA
ncbi:CvpA family protein, partial [Escherichia coli]|nr:CvpA family protein [Escherichia coli]